MKRRDCNPNGHEWVVIGNERHCYMCNRTQKRKNSYALWVSVITSTSKTFYYKYNAPK